MMVLAVAASGVMLAGCTKNVDRAQRDVERARDQAAQEVREEQRDLEEVRRDAAARVARQERRVEDAARRGNEQVIEERRELEDARREEARQDAARRDASEPPPRLDNPPPEGAARVDVNINRGPGGNVNVDVKRNP
jgi:hypothetical protein